MGGGLFLRGYYLIKYVFIIYVKIDSSVDFSSFYNNHKMSFSAMKLIKTRLRNTIENELLADYIVVYIEKDIANNFNIEMTMDEFYFAKDCH